MTMRILPGIVFGIAVAALAPAAAAADPVQLNYAARAGILNEVVAATCIRITGQPATGEALTGVRQDRTEVLLYRPAENQNAMNMVRIDMGKEARVGEQCPNAVDTTYIISVDGQPEVPPDALEKAFRVLVAAFVVALLLESAFELLFNWRLFQAFFVGRAWRTPIMFGISLAIVRQFDLDLMSSLFNAYHGGPGAGASGNWVSSCLTAMIVAGGSVGVNKILVGLGFRSRLPKAEQEAQQLGSQEAYLSVEVRNKSAAAQYRIDITECPCADTPTTVAVLQAPGPGRVRQLLFPSSFRTPRSGGRRVATDKCYQITIVDLRSGALHDVSGTRIDSPKAAAPMRFAPRTIVDFVVVLQETA